MTVEEGLKLIMSLGVVTPSAFPEVAPHQAKS
jgi:uncharacterized membrane protein